MPSPAASDYRLAGLASTTSMQFRASNKTLAEELVSENAIFYVPGREAPVIGPRGYLEIFAILHSVFPNIQWALEEMSAEGDKLSARFVMRCTNLETFFGVPASRNDNLRSG